jgi:hypothetical protein
MKAVTTNGRRTGLRIGKPRFALVFRSLFGHAFRLVLLLQIAMKLPELSLQLLPFPFQLPEPLVEITAFSFRSARRIHGSKFADVSYQISHLLVAQPVREARHDASFAVPDTDLELDVADLSLPGGPRKIGHFGGACVAAGAVCFMTFGAELGVERRRVFFRNRGPRLRLLGKPGCESRPAK